MTANNLLAVYRDAIAEGRDEAAAAIEAELLEDQGVRERCNGRLVSSRYLGHVGDNWINVWWSNLYTNRDLPHFISDPDSDAIMLRFRSWANVITYRTATFPVDV